MQKHLKTCRFKTKKVVFKKLIFAVLNGVSYQYFALDQFLLEPFCTKFWRRKWQPTPVFLSRESCGRRSLVGCVHRVAESQTWLKRLSMHACIGEGNDNPFQYSCLENPRDRGAWWAAVYGVAQSRTGLKQLSGSGGGTKFSRPLTERYFKSYRWK